MHHSLDIWHKAKKLKKGLHEVCIPRVYLSIDFLFQAGKLRGMGKLGKWSNNIVNHFWFCSQTCEGKLESLKVTMLRWHFTFIMITTS